MNSKPLGQEEPNILVCNPEIKEPVRVQPVDYAWDYRIVVEQCHFATAHPYAQLQYLFILGPTGFN